MPNVLDAEPLRAFARRITAKLDDPALAARLEKLAFDALLNDPRNFRLASDDELAEAPEWARAARRRGDEVHVVLLHRGATARLRTLARRLSDTTRVAAADVAERPRDAAIITAAREFLDKFGRVNIDVAARKALAFSRVLAVWADDRDAEPRCEARAVLATQGRIWRRVRSVAELRAIGREFRNCLARTTRMAAYGRMLHDGFAQFWVLRDSENNGLLVAMAPAPFALGFTEVRGPRNAPVVPGQGHVDLCRLARAIGIPRDDPPPPAGTAALALPQRRRRAAALTRLAS